MRLLIVILLICLFALGCNDRERIIEVRDESGRIAERYEVNRDTIKEGLYQAFDKEENLLEEAHYYQGLLHGQRKIFYPNQQVEIIENYDNGLLVGEYLHFYSTGLVSFKASYDRNVLRGKTFRYYPSGKLMEEVIFENNEENGPFIEYYENGNKKWEGHYLNGDNEVGELLHYNEQGELERKLICDSLSICQSIWTKEAGDIQPRNLRTDGE